jgi:Icc-related predicted phosphoesterase
MRILAIADETDRALSPQRLRDMKPDLVISCGDLGHDYLDFVASAANASLVFVPGNHDPVPASRKAAPVPGFLHFDDLWGDGGSAEEGITQASGINADGQIVAIKGLTIAGLGGSIRYKEGPNQYTERQMAARARRLRRQARIRRAPVDLLITHSPPKGIGDESDGPHQGFACFIPLIEALKPRMMLHGHIHPHGFVKPDRQLGDTRIINVIPHKLLEVEL